MITLVYSILHFLVDAMCALAMFSSFLLSENRTLYVLIYNFCAFALQMPIGIMLDWFQIWDTKENRQNYLAKYSSFICAGVGVGLTILGVFTHPAILGLGNACFHVGAGVDVIKEDFRKNWRGCALGVYVAPGALGLYLGTLLANNGSDYYICYGFWTYGIMMIMLLAVLVHIIVTKSSVSVRTITIFPYETSKKGRTNRRRNCGMGFILCCFFVVVLRSYVGLAISFPWKTTVFIGIISVLAVVLGKMAGGFASAYIGTGKTIVISLLLSAICYMFSENAVAGVAALFFFNMTMPITLYLLVHKYKTASGFFFGMLTFALFLGFLPVYLKMDLPISGNLAGMAGSLLSLFILGGALKLKDIMSCR